MKNDMVASIIQKSQLETSTMTLQNLIAVISPFISAVAAIATFVFVYKQHKIHYDSELTGYIKRSLKKNNSRFSLDCTLVNSGGIPIVLDKICYSFFSKKNRQSYLQEVDKSKILYGSNLDTSWTLEKSQSITITIPFVEWDYNGHSAFGWISELGKVNKIEIIFQYFVYKTSKSLKISYIPNK